MSFSALFSRPTYPTVGVDHRLRPILPEGGSSLQFWEEQLRPELRRQWLEALGEPGFCPDDYTQASTLLGEQTFEEFHLASYRQPTGPGQSQHVLILRPLSTDDTPRPCAIIPFYTAERAAGVVASEVHGNYDLQQSKPEATLSDYVRQFGLHLVRLGFVVACVEAYPFNMVPNPGSRDFQGLWGTAAAELHAVYPRWTGIGKLRHDTSRALDLLLEQPGIDRDRVVIMGHSLGGKMAFYTGCLDERISCIIASDYGLPWDSTNWNAAWYFGEKRPATEVLAHHQLLALHAPKPFFLIAGDTDKRESWQYLEGARPVYDLYGAGDCLGVIDHASGHSPTVAALEITYAWLAEHFKLPHTRWRA